MKETKFKNTEIGWIPEDWEIKSLEFVFDVLPNNTLSRDCLNYSKGEYQNVHYGDVLIKYGEYVDCQNDVLPFVNYDCKFNKTLLRNGDVVMADTAEDETAGKVTEIVNSDNMKIVSGLHTIPLRPKVIFASKFLGYAMNASSYHKQLLTIQSGTKVTSVSKSSIITTKLAYPPTLTEQSRIAQALSDIDSLIDSLDKLIQKKRNIKQGAMQELLTGKKRLKGFVKPWVKKKISDLGVLTGAGVDKKSYHNETPVRLVNYVDILHSDFLYNNQLDFWVTANNQKLIQCNVKKGDVFFTPSSEMPYDIAFSAVAMEDMENVCYSYHIYRLRFNEDVDLKYRTYMFKTYDFYYQANQTCEGSGKRYVISLAKFRDMTVVYPQDKSEQTAIATILSDMDSEIESLEAKMEKYKAIKQGMMQELLSGRIRLV